jgi:hypothetical protein
VIYVYFSIIHTYKISHDHDDSVAASGYKLFLMMKFSCILKQKYRAYFYKILNALGKLMVK